jgi:hypothetical protein
VHKEWSFSCTFCALVQHHKRVLCSPLPNIYLKIVLESLALAPGFIYQQSPPPRTGCTPPATRITGMAPLKQLAPRLWAGVAVAAASGAAYCEADNSKYFDPEALERGAKALREIQSSPFAKRVSVHGLMALRYRQCGSWCVKFKR